ncbi:glutathione S-transferase family protein [Polynucleobacter sp. MWH-UH2A]|uniref:glutathione S-transferase family protein n=1 Tax=Polynucleobacter sp. MWH-UH2A TaxID=1855617 RepID=UPI001BFE133E|nr:glutathione S-transferase family protein [Polynucleobacter sp. MWH-UH2A]QWD64710.1 glutathione S-transferase family protein [Polynucleobacter sp. MWH-UH2A]
MPKQTTLTISSKNYSSWSLRGWLMLKLSGLPFQEIVVSPDDVDNRAELLLLSPSILVPRLDHDGCRVWDTMAIGEYLNELKPGSHLLPKDPIARAHCRSVCGEMHSGFSALRASLPMNIKAKFASFKIWSKAQIDINRIVVVWQDCLTSYGGPFLFGKEPTLADAMFAPVVTRFLTYHVALDKACEKYCDHIMAMPEMREWVMGALEEPDDIEELEVEF